MVLYPLKFNSIYKKKIWGGHRLRTLFKRNISASERIGESWEIADCGADTTTVKNGALAGKKLHDIVGALNLTPLQTFPLIVKLIDTSETLSIQVHPDDAYAQKHEGHIPAPCHSEAQPKNLCVQGKMEAWYIIHAEPGARVVHGVIPGTTVEGLKKLLEAGRIEECLNSITVKAGDVVFIPPGMVHTIGAGILLLEVSQNSDATYRLFDWNRLGENGTPRPLHIEKALDVMRNAECGMRNKKNLKNSELRTPCPTDGRRANSELLLACPKFSLELLEFEKYIEERNETDRFHILSVIKGEGRLEYGEDKKGIESFSEGESILIPASLKSYGILPSPPPHPSPLEGEGRVGGKVLPSKMCRIIKTSVP